MTLADTSHFTLTKKTSTHAFVYRYTILYTNTPTHTNTRASESYTRTWGEPKITDAFCCFFVDVFFEAERQDFAGVLWRCEGPAVGGVSVFTGSSAECHTRDD